MLTCCLPFPSQVFQKQVLYGCVRFKRALKVFLSSFFYNNAAKCARSDYTMYMVLGYLALFRLKELGWSEPVFHFAALLPLPPCCRCHGRRLLAVLTRRARARVARCCRRRRPQGL